MTFLLVNFAVKNAMFNLNENNRFVMVQHPSSVRATCFMRGTPLVTSYAFMCYALSARGIFAREAQKCRMCKSLHPFPPGVARGCVQHLGLQSATIIPLSANFAQSYTHFLPRETQHTRH